MDKLQTRNYRTRDLAQAAALIMHKQRLLDVEKEGNICWFVFQDQEACHKLEDRYFFEELTVNAREYHETMTRLKNKIFSVL